MTGRSRRTMAKIAAATAAVALMVLLLLAVWDRFRAADIEVRPAERFQIMQGWEALTSGPVECDPRAWATNLSRVQDLAALDLGLNRVRIPIRAGYEDSTDHFTPYIRGEISFDDWKRTWHHPVNDNADPQVANPRGFQWGYLDHTIEKAVLPLRDRVRRRGDDLWINLGYTGTRSARLHQTDPEEYAELVLATFEHLRDKYGIVPNSFEIVNEPNLAKWSAEQVARSLMAAKRRLDARGFHPQYGGPSTTTIYAALPLLDSMLTFPGVRETLTDVVYHRYGGSTDALRRLRARAESLGYRTGMGEKMGAGVDELYEDLTVGQVSAWQQFGLAHCPPRGEGEGGGIYVIFHQENPERADARLAPKSRYLRQYFRYIRLGAQRVGASSDVEGARSTAFVNRDGTFVVVVAGDRARDLRVSGLPAGRYGVTYTTERDDNAASPDTTITADGVVHARLPAKGVLTIFGK